MLIPGQNDVLLGRGTPINNHEGNINYRNIVRYYKDGYLAARSNYEKYLITMEVRQRIKNLYPPGRFIRKDSNTNTWIEVDDKETKNKISQALRENPHKYEPCLKNMKPDCNNERICMNAICSDSNRSKALVGDVAQNKIVANPSVSSTTFELPLIEDSCNNRANDVKVETVHSIPPEPIVLDAKKQNTFYPHDPCAKFSCNGDDYKSDIKTDRLMLVSSSDVKKIHEELSCDGKKNGDLFNDFLDIEDVSIIGACDFAHGLDAQLDSSFAIGYDQSLLGQDFNEDYLTEIMKV